MSPEFVIDTMRGAFLTAMWVSAPILLIGFVAGVAISLVQVLTSLQDSAFSTAPRLAAFLAAFLLALPWMLHRMAAYTSQLLGNLGRYAN